MVMRSGYKANKRSSCGIYYRVFREEAGYMVLKFVKCTNDCLHKNFLSIKILACFMSILVVDLLTERSNVCMQLDLEFSLRLHLAESKPLKNLYCFCIKDVLHLLTSFGFNRHQFV